MTVGLDQLRAGQAECPSDLALDRLRAGELGAELAADVQRHVATCAMCTKRLEVRASGFAGLPGVSEERMFAAIRVGLAASPSPEPRPALWWRRWVLGAGGLAVALLLLVVARRPAVPEDGERLKGGLALHVFRYRAGHAEPTFSGEAFAPGDRLRFAVDLPHEGFVRILGVESSGTMYPAWPLGDAPSTKLAAGTAIPLEGAVALDDHPGREVLYLVLCPPEVGPPSCSAGGQGPPACPAACSLSSFALEKGP